MNTLSLRSGKTINKMSHEQSVPTDDSNGIIDDHNDISQTNNNNENTIVNKESEIIISFDPDRGMNFNNWLIYFNKQCDYLQKNDIWKFLNFQKYLKNSAVTTYINCCLHLNDFNDICEVFKTTYCESSSFTFSNFTNLSYKCGDDLKKYFQRKTEYGRNLKLSNEFILEGLTDGLPNELKKFVVVNPPKTLIDWLSQVSKLVSLNDVTINVTKSNDNSREVISLKQTPKPENRPWRPLVRFPSSPGASYPYFPGNSQFRPSYYSSRPQFSSYSGQSRPRINFQVPNALTYVQPRQQTHNNVQLPPYPCHACTQRNVPNSYHWKRECPFQQNVGRPHTFTSENEVGNRNVPRNNELNTIEGVDDNGGI